MTAQDMQKLNDLQWKIANRKGTAEDNKEVQRLTDQLQTERFGGPATGAGVIGGKTKI